MRIYRVMVLLASLVSSFYISCSQKPNDQRISKECIKKNNLAAEFISSFYLTGTSVKLDSAEILLRSAISCDTSYFLAYSNLATVLTLKEDYYSAIKIVDKVLVLTNHDPEVLIYKGILFEKVGKKDLADTQYISATRKFKETIELFPDSLEIVGSMLYLKAYTDGQESALRDLQTYQKKYPDSELLNQFHEMLVSFDKNAFVGSVGSPFKYRAVH